MMRFDHLNLPVSNLERSRAWWTGVLGLQVEFEVPNTRTLALNDGEGFAIFLQEKPNVSPNGVTHSNVDSVFVAGKARKRNGKLLDLDFASFRKKVDAARDGLFARAGVPSDGSWIVKPYAEEPAF